MLAKEIIEEPKVYFVLNQVLYYCNKRTRSVRIFTLFHDKTVF